jgi:hypothetical protein
MGRKGLIYRDTIADVRRRDVAQVRFDKEEARMEKRGFHGRGFFSLLSFGGFLLLFITGIVLFIMPHGRIAYWTDWRFLGLTKDHWGSIHICSGVVFIVAGALHVFYYNWKPLTNYIARKVAGSRLKTELAISSVIMLFVIVGAIYGIPPLSPFLDFNEYVKSSWVTSKEYEPPFGHAEDLSLKVFARKMKMDLDKAVEELKSQGITLESDRDTLEEVARSNNTSPMHIYAMIKKYEEKPQVVKQETYTPELVEEQFAGMGVGRKTLAAVCAEIGVDIAQAKGQLAKQNIVIKEDEALKKAAEKHGVTPLDILKIILVKDFKLPKT